MPGEVEMAEKSKGGDDRRCSWNRDPKKEKHGGKSSGSSSATSTRKRHSNESVSSVTAEMANKRAKTVSSPTAKMSTKRERTSLSSPTAKLSTKRAKTSLSGQSSPAPEMTNDNDYLVRKEMELKELTASLNRLKAMLAMCTPPTSPGTNDINDTDVTPQPLLGNMENAVEVLPSQTPLLVDNNSSIPLPRVDNKDEGTQKVGSDNFGGGSWDTGSCLEQQLHKEAELTEERAILLGQEPDDCQHTGSEQNTWSGQDQSVAQIHRQLNKDEQFCQDKTLLQYRTAARSEESQRGQELYEPFQVDEEDENKSMEETTKKQPAFDTSNISIYRSPAAETNEDEEELIMKVRELERLNALIAEGKAMLAMKTQDTPPDCECPNQADKTPEISTKCQPHGFLPVLQQTPSSVDNHRTTALSEKSCGAKLYNPFEVDAEDENTMMEGSIKGLHHDSQQQEVTAEEVGTGTGPYCGIDMVSPVEGQLLSRVKGAGIGGMGIVSHREDRSFSQPELEDEETYLYGGKPGDCPPACTGSKHLKSSNKCEKTEQTLSPDKSDVPKLTFREIETILLSMGFSFPQSSTVNQLGSKADEAIKTHGATPSLFSSHVDTHGRQVYDPFQVSQEEHGNEAVEATKREHDNPHMEEKLRHHGNQLVKAGVGEQWNQATEAITGQPETGGYGKQLVESFIEDLENPLMETAIRQHGNNRPLEEGPLVQPQDGLLEEDRNVLIGYDLESSKQEGEDFFSRAEKDKEHNRSKEHETGGQTKCMDKNHQANKATPKVDSLQHPQGPVTNSVETIWICGDGLVDLASRLANSPTYGMKLGQSIAGVRLYWKGELAMKWAGLVPQLLQLARDWPIPDMLIIHLGDDDIILRDTQELQCAMEKDLTFIHNLFPHCLIVWSDLLPNKISKQGSSALVVQDGIHDVVNRRMHDVVAALGGTALTHELLIPELYRLQGARFSRLVVEKLFLNIKQFVGQWSLEVHHASEMCSPECHPLPCASSFTCSIPDDSIHPKSTNSHSKHKERPPSHPPSLPKKQEQVGEGQVKPKEVRQSTETVKRSTGVMEAKQCMEQRTPSPEVVKPCPVPDESSASTHPQSPNSHPKPEEKSFSTMVLNKLQVGEESRKKAKCSTEDRKWPTEEAKMSTEKEKQYTEVARPSTEEPKQSPEDAKLSREEAKQSTEEARKAALAGARAVFAEKRAALEAQKAALEAMLAKFAVSPTLPYSEHTTDQQIEEKQRFKINQTKTNKVWVFGDSRVVKSVQKRLFMYQIKKHGFWISYWIPLADVTLSKVIEHLMEARCCRPFPDMLIIHLGSFCDIPHGNLEEMVLTIQEHLLMIRRIFPGCVLVWSDILSRTHRETQGHEDAHSADLASNRHEVTQRLHNVVKQLGGAAITHGNIQSEHFDCERSQLSDVGEQLFQQNIVDFVDQWKWDHNSTRSLSEPLPEPTRPADHKEMLGPSTDRTVQPITGCGTQKAGRVVWICGKALCGFARDSAEQQSIPLRSGTGSLEVVWKVVCKKNFLLKNLLSSEDKVIRQPDMAIIYLGSADLSGKWKLVARTFKREMRLLHRVFPECLIVWSDIVKGMKVNKTDPGLDLTNSIKDFVVTALGARVVTHNNIGPELFRGWPNKKVISRVTQRANLNIQEFVLKWETEVSGLAQNTKPSPQ
ncbi:uncharacterized protein LOC134440837 isoform X2 [Engraulis encrasicolus]|uniref:uncharacterized protein LOC134440837 isoform X2 n=1 Tax=Engraulis encrasicolus TaxID=184585 RepID=UPI002FCF3D71